MNISYDSEDLIEELKRDIDEFGNIEMYAFFEKINGITFLTNYDFIVEEDKLKANEIENCVVMVLKAKKILKILEEQNKIIK